LRIITGVQEKFFLTKGTTLAYQTINLHPNQGNPQEIDRYLSKMDTSLNKKRATDQTIQKPLPRLGIFQIGKSGVSCKSLMGNVPMLKVKDINIATRFFVLEILALMANAILDLQNEWFVFRETCHATFRANHGIGFSKGLSGGCLETYQLDLTHSFLKTYIPDGLRLVFWQVDNPQKPVSQVR
jgi:hypothetical protein